MGSRRGRLPLGLGRQPLPRRARRLRDVQRGPQQPARPRGADRGARASAPGLGAARRRLAPCAAGRGAPAPCARLARQGDLHELGRGGGRGRDQARPRRDRTPARALGGARLPRAHARRALRDGHTRVPRPLRPAAARLRAGADRRPRRTRARARVGGRGALHRGARPGEGRDPAAGRLPRERPGAVPPLRDALLRRRGADGLRAHRPPARARALGAPARPGHRRQVAVGRLCAGRRAADVGRRLRGRLRLAAERGQPRLDLRAERPRDGRRARDAARARRARPRRALGSARRAAAGAYAAACRTLRRRRGCARPRADVGDRVPGAAAAGRARGSCSSGSSPGCSRSS